MKKPLPFSTFPWVAVSVCALLVSGCVERSQEATPAEQREMAQYVVSEEPTPEQRVRVRFEDKVELIGYDVSPDAVGPGQTLTITWYWKVLRAVDPGWRQFTHVEDGSSNVAINADGMGKVREHLPPPEWRAGNYVKDVQRIAFPPEWVGSRATFYVGFWKGRDRMDITAGPNDGDDRARAAVIPIRRGGGRPEPRPPEHPSLTVARASEITIDGELDEPSWREAESTQAFVNTGTGRRAAFLASAKTLWDDDHLYVAFEVRDDNLRSRFESHDDHLWEQDCVEVFLDPTGDGRNYFEIQVSPRGVHFDTRYDARRRPQPFGHVDWDSDLRAEVRLAGTLGDDREDEGYTVEMAIPFAALAKGEPPIDEPSAGDSWRANFYVMNDTGEGMKAAGWSPPRIGDFHVPSRFGNLDFVD